MIETKKKFLLTDTISYVGANYIAQGIGVINSIALRAFMGPVAMGVWSMLQVILGYCGYASFGVTKAMSRDYPFLRGKGEHAEAEKLKDMTLTFSMLMSFVPVSILLGYLLMQYGHLEPSYRVGLIFLVFFLFIQRFNDLIVLLLRSDKKFSVLNRSIVINAVGGLAVTFLLVKHWNIYGLLFGTAAVTLGTLWFIQKCNPYHFSFYWNNEGLWKELKLGIPLVAASFLGTFLKNMDKLLIAKMLGFYTLGLYSIAMMASTYVLSFPMLFAHVWYPNLQEKYGVHEDVHAIKNYLLKPVFVLSILVPFACFMAIYLVPVVAFLFMHKFLDGLVALKIYLSGSFFLLLAQFSTSFLTTIDKYLITIPILIVSVAANFILNYLAIKAGYGLAGVSAATVVSFIIYGLGSYIAAIRNFVPAHEVIWTLSKSGVCFTFFLIAGYGLDYFIVINNLFLSASIKILIYTALSIPFFVFMDRETKLFSHLLGILFEKMNWGKVNG